MEPAIPAGRVNRRQAASSVARGHGKETLANCKVQDQGTGMVDPPSTCIIVARAELLLDSVSAREAPGQGSSWGVLGIVACVCVMLAADALVESVGD